MATTRLPRCGARRIGTISIGVCGPLSALYGGRKSVVACPVAFSISRCVAFSSAIVISCEMVATLGKSEAKRS